MSQPTRHHYFRAGRIERGADYHWCDGYSRVTECGITSPWLTRREAQQQAKSEGGIAVFHESEQDARAERTS